MAIPSLNFLICLLLGWIGLVWIKRALWVMRLKKRHPPLGLLPLPPIPPPQVSLILPARDEEKNIGHCLSHLFKQDYPNFEIIVVDDRSQDRTPHLLENFKTLSPVPFKIIRIEKLPPGWTGKNYALFTGSKAASGDFLFFTDADTTHKPESLRTALAHALSQKIDFLTLTPQIECKSFWENTVQPLASSSLALWFDPQRMEDPKNPLVLANGQFILVRREAYEKVGGNEIVKNEVVEDVELARRVLKAGFCVKFLNGTSLYSTRMYTSLREIHRGWTRILTYLFDKKAGAILHKIFLFILFSILPFVTLFNPFSPAILWLSVLVCAFIVAVRFAGNRMMKTNPWYAFLHPLGSLVMVWILFTCAFRILLNRPSPWRGDQYK